MPTSSGRQDEVRVKEKADSRRSNASTSPHRLHRHWHSEPPFTTSPLGPSPSARTIPGHHLSLTSSTTRAFLTAHLSLSKLNAIHTHLWVAGRPGNYPPLHYHLMLQRQIVRTTNPAMHMVWIGNIVYFCMVGRWLLDVGFWREWICAGDEGGADSDNLVKNEESMEQEARGLLYSYLRVIVDECDFDVAVENGLLPKDMTWDQWGTFALELSHTLIDPNSISQYPFFPLPHTPNSPHKDQLVPQPTLININKRYEYGLLRLSRLNLLYNLLYLQLAYHHVYTDYASFLTSYFAWIFIVFAYASVILTAFQTMLSTGGGDDSGATALVPLSGGIVRVAFWFSVTTLVVTAVGLALQISLFSVVFMINLIKALRRPRARWEKTRPKDV